MTFCLRLAVAAVFLAVLATHCSAREVWVRPYSRSDGTRVSGHYRTLPGRTSYYFVQRPCYGPTWTTIDVTAYARSVQRAKRRRAEAIGEQYKMQRIQTMREEKQFKREENRRKYLARFADREDE